MTMSLGYVNEKFSVAVDVLATSTESIQGRIAGAWMSSLMRLKAEDFPPQLRVEFVEMRDQMVGHGTFDEAAARMSDEEAREHAKRIVAMHFAVIRENH